MPFRNLHAATVAAFPNFSEAQIQLLQALLLAPQHASSANQLRTLLGFKAVVQVNNAIGGAAHEVFKHLQAHPDGFEQGDFQWWTVLAIGKHTRRSGFIWTLRPEVVSALTACGLAPGDAAGAEEAPYGNKLFEGAVRRAQADVYERNMIARARCIEHYGPECAVCRINFEKVYGRLAEGFIHVHHLRPMNSIGHRYEVDPIADLRPVCPNCHAVVHMADPPYTLEEVRAFIARRRNDV